MLDLLQSYSLSGLFIIILIEEAGVPLPIPGDIFIATVSSLPNSNYLLVVAIVTIAIILGSSILFYLSKKYGRRLLKRYGNRINLTPQRIKKFEKWFKKYGGLTITIGRLIPGLRIVIPIVAGLLNISYKIFLIYTILAALIWSTAYFIVGKFFYEIIARFA